MLLRKWLSVIGNTFLYAGLGKEEFKNVYPQMREQMRDDNKRTLQIFSAIGAVLSMIMLILSVIRNELNAFCILYTVMTGICLAVFCANRFWLKTVPALRVAGYFFVSATLAFAILLGTCFSPKELAATFMVFLILAPLSFVDRPIHFLPIIVAAYIAFVILAAIYKSGDTNVLNTDLTNATLFVLFSVAICVYSMNMKLQKYHLEYINRIASETDTLTGVKNRKCYESTVLSLPSPLPDNTFFLFVDANGLHALNDDRGHAEGDAMLRFVAAKIREAFGNDVYRIGGDEFVVFGTGLSEEEINGKIGSTVLAITAGGYSISAGYALGNASIRELMKNAEQKMYAAKAAYYASSGINRRRH